MRHICKLALAALLVTGNIYGAQAAAELRQLNDIELDNIAAGYLTIEVVASAEASGAVTETFTFTDASVRQLPSRGDGYIYTKGKGYAFAFAKGDDVSTYVNGLIDTDEEIVSIKYIYKTKNNGRKNNERKKNGKHDRKPKLRKEKSVLIIRVTTRTIKR